MDRITRQVNDAKKLTVTRLDVATLGTLTADDAPEFNRSGFKEIGTSMGGSWFGGLQNMAEARALFLNGWQAGADMADTLRPDLAEAIPAGTITRRRRTTGDDGDDLILDAALAGNWDAAFSRRSPVRVEDPAVISLTAGWLAPGSVSHADLIWNALQAIVLTDALESAGYRVELRAFDATRTYRLHGYTQAVEIMLKRAEEPLRADLVAATLGHAGVYRSLGFQSMWIVPKPQQPSMGACLKASDVPALIEDATTTGMIAPVSYALPRADDCATARQNLKNAVRALFPDRAGAAV